MPFGLKNRIKFHATFAENIKASHLERAKLDDFSWKFTVESNALTPNSKFDQEVA